MTYTKVDTTMSLNLKGKITMPKTCRPVLSNPQMNTEEVAREIESNLIVANR